MDIHGFPVRLIGQNDAPAWVQAIGSIVAILVAIAIPLIASWHRRRQFQRAVLGHGRMIRDAVRAVAIYSGIEPIVADKYGLQITSIEVKLPLLFETAKGLPLEELRSAEATEAFIRLIGAAMTFVEAVDAHASDPVGWVEDLVNGATLRRAAYEAVRARYDDLHRVLSKSGIGVWAFS